MKIVINTPMLKFRYLFFTCNKHATVPVFVKKAQLIPAPATKQEFCSAKESEDGIYPLCNINTTINDHSDNLTYQSADFASLYTSCPNPDKFYVTDANNKLISLVNSPIDLQRTNTQNS